MVKKTVLRSMFYVKEFQPPSLPPLKGGRLRDGGMLNKTLLWSYSIYSLTGFHVLSGLYDFIF